MSCNPQKPFLVNDLELITPERAAIFLRDQRPNRNKTQVRIELFASQMERGEWKTTHQGLAFDRDGRMIDGQHRCEAIIKSGKSQWFYVTRLVEDEALMAIDSGGKRSDADRIKISIPGTWINKNVIAVVRQLIDSRTSLNQVCDFAQHFQQSIIFALEHTSSNKKYLSTAVVRAQIVLAHINGVSPGVLSNFCHVLITGQARSELDDVVIRLREKLLVLLGATSRHDLREHVKLLTQKAISDFNNRKVVKKLCKPDRPIWTVPNWKSMIINNEEPYWEDPRDRNHQASGAVGRPSGVRRLHGIRGSAGTA